MELLTQLLELLKNDPAGFFTTILSYAGTTTISGASIWAIVQFGKSLFRKLTHADTKLKASLNSIVAEKVLPLKTDLLALQDTITQTVSTTLADIKTQFTGELVQLKTQMNELLSQSTALAGTVLNTKELQLKYDNLQREFLLLKEKAETAVKEVGEQAKAEITAVAKDIEPEVTGIVQEVKKIRLKRG